MVVQQVVNIHRIVYGHSAEGLKTHILSPFSKVLSKDEAEVELLQFSQRPESEKTRILEEFHAFFVWFGLDLIEFRMVEDEIGDDVTTGVSVTLSDQPLDLRSLLLRFLEENDFPILLSPSRRAFCVFSFDMSIGIYSLAPLKSVPSFEGIFLVPI